MRGLALFVFAALLTAQPANAATTIYKLGAVCVFDIQQYCKGIGLKKLRELKECLAKHEKELLPFCQDHYKEAS